MSSGGSRRKGSWREAGLWPRSGRGCGSQARVSLGPVLADGTTEWRVAGGPGACHWPSRKGILGVAELSRIPKTPPHLIIGGQVNGSSMWVGTCNSLHKFMDFTSMNPPGLSSLCPPPSTWHIMGPLHLFVAWMNQQIEQNKAQRA